MSYQIHLRPVVNWDAKPLPPLPLDPGRSRRPHKPAFNNDTEKSIARAHRGGKVFPQELDISKVLEADSRVVVDKPRRARQTCQSPSVASVPKDFMSVKRPEDQDRDIAGHSRQMSDQSTNRFIRSTPLPSAITSVEDLSLPPKVRQIIGIDSPRVARTTPWNPTSTQAAPNSSTLPRPTSTATAYSQASGHRRDVDMLFHMEEIVEEQGKAEDDDEILRRLDSLIRSPGYAAIRCHPDSLVSQSNFSLSAANSHEDMPRQQTPMSHPEQPPQDQRSSREMYHDLVVELAQSAPAALPPPPKPPTELGGGLSDSSSLHHRRHRSTPSKQAGQLHRGNASCPQLSRPTTRSPHISVFDHESSDSESDSDSKPLWSPKFAFLGRRPISKPSKRR
ncbi:hypothetical protein J7T55_014036 [Diaporthe amygdali]|uniref:uncharacterized protein n=1 Tax=Phomopsis amygdali TaxID=1214568 RepID=UPI0022FE6C7B|nr:uncharacterized protein J7T55_014036 [Diaporthe amygdali]KAJ0119831.1 hypothetical protein J7T55_014036 [Diaporthe amygdali]